MKSIMKLAERDAGHAALTAPRHQQHHNQFQSSLPNGKIELMWFVAADGALMEFLWFAFFCLLAGRLWAARGHSAPQREDKQEEQTKWKD
jgi:hypothetical protein